MEQDTPTIDIAVYNDLKEMMGARFTKFLKNYLAHTDEHTKAGETALVEGDIKIVLRAVHSIKSTSIALGATKIADITETIQDMIVSCEDSSTPVPISDIIPLYEDLLLEYSSVKNVLLEDLQ